MKEVVTDYGLIRAGTKEEVFAHAVELASTAQRASTAARFTWALTGGSTPGEFYDWCVARKALPPALLNETHWSVSDERHVPVSSSESNWGNAVRRLLDPLGVSPSKRHPWNSALAPREAAAAFAKDMSAQAGAKRGFDLCFLGLGQDCHTASWFPGNPLAGIEGGQYFAAIETARGWRLTITPTGLYACGQVVVMTLGRDKAAALARVIKGSYDPSQVPAQLLKPCASRVIWLVDSAAISGLGA